MNKCEGITYRPVLSLVGQSDSGLNKLSRHVVRPKLGPIARNARLRRVNRALHWGDQTCQFFFDFWFANVIEVRMSESLLASEPLRRVHFEKADHELQSFLRQTRHVSFLKSLRLSDLRELEAYKSWVLVE